mmetsp:Transcript_2960/g.6250  ORF Transcript_2960/g.6250 Transcript_2960/m.6250 type:complete len:288 (-) Transcript_2960:65-928(-)
MRSRLTFSSTSPSSYSSLAVPSACTSSTTPSYQNLPPKYLALTRSPMTRSTRAARLAAAEEDAWPPLAVPLAVPLGLPLSLPSSPSSSLSSSSVPTRSSRPSPTASASSTKRFGSTEKRSLPVSPCTRLPFSSSPFAFLSLPLCALALASTLVCSHACSRSSVTGVRLLMRARCHSIFSSSSVGSTSTTSSTFFSTLTSFFFGFFTASWKSSASSAIAWARFCSSCFFLFICASTAWPPCACLIIMAACLLFDLFFIPNVLSAAFAATGFPFPFGGIAAEGGCPRAQ